MYFWGVDVMEASAKFPLKEGAFVTLSPIPLLWRSKGGLNFKAMKLFFAFCLLLVGVGVFGQANVAEQRKPFMFLDKGDSTKLKLVSVKGDTLDLCHGRFYQDLSSNGHSWFANSFNVLADSQLHSFMDNYFRFLVKKQGKYGVCNWQGILQTDYVYDTIATVGGYYVALLGNDCKNCAFVGNRQKYNLGKWNYGETLRIKVYNPTKKETSNALLVQKNGKYGLIDSVGNELVPAAYSDIWKTAKSDSVEVNAWGVRFANSNVWVKLTEQYNKQNKFSFAANQVVFIGNEQGVINRFGDFIAGSKYDRIWKLKGDILIAQKNNQVGMVNLSGKTIIPFAYKALTLFENGLALGIDGKNKGFFIDTSGKQMATDGFDVFMNKEREGYNCLCFYGNISFSTECGSDCYYKEFQFSNHLIPVGKYKPTQLFLYPFGLKYGYMDTIGHLVIPFIFDEASRFDKGVAIVKMGGFYGIIDTTGNWILPAEYKFIEVGKEFGWFNATTKDDKTFFLRQIGNTVVATDYQKVINFQKMFSANFNNKVPISIVQKSNLWGIVDSANRVIVPIVYDDCKVLVNICALWKGQTVSFWDFKGEKLPIGEYDTVFVHKKNTLDAYLAVKKNGKWGFINVWEATSTPNMVYDSVYLPVKDRNGRMVLVERDNRLGYCHLYGEEIVPPMYLLPPLLANEQKIMLIEGNKVLTMDETNEHLSKILCYLPKNVFIVEQKYADTGIKYCNLQDKKGTVLSKNYDAMQWCGDAKTTFVVAQNGKLCGLLNLKGQEIVPLKYTHIGSFNDDLAIVDSAGLKGLIDKSGKVVCKTRYRELYYDAQAALFRGWSNTSKCWIDKTGKEYSETEYGDTRIRLTANSTLIWYKGVGISVVDNNNKVLKSIVDYSNLVQLFPMRCFIASKNGYFGVIDSLLGVVVPFVYSSMKYGGNGLLIVSKNNRYGCINLQNKVLVPLVYEELGNVQLTELDDNEVFIATNSGLMAAKLGGYYGAVDMHNKIIVPFEYDDVIIERGDCSSSVQGGIKVIKNHRYGYFDLNGKLVEPCVRYYVLER